MFTPGIPVFFDLGPGKHNTSRGLAIGTYGFLPKLTLSSQRM